MSHIVNKVADQAAERGVIMNALDLNEIASSLSDLRLLENRAIFVSEAINSRVAKSVISNLLMLEAISPGKPITMYINSPGGEVNSGYAIFDTMRFISSEIRVVGTGLIASIATVIFVGADKKHRFSLPNSKFLIHQPLIGGQVYGQASDLEITAKEILKTRAKINDLLAKECGQKLEKIEHDTSRDYWMTAEEAVEYGLCTKIITSNTELK